MRRRGPPRVLGPYAEKSGFRLIVVENCARRSLFFPTREESLRMQARLCTEMQRPPMLELRHALAEWTAERVRVGQCQAETAAHQLGRLHHFLRSHLDRELGALTSAHAQQLYEALVATPSVKTGSPLSAASHRYTLAIAKSFFHWAVSRRYLTASPFADVRPTGKVNTGKPQLRIDEARRFVAAAESEFDKTGSPLAVGVLLALFMGLRAGEVLGRCVRDVDDDGQTLWIDAGKTRHARRHLEVPALLRPRLLSLISGRVPTEPLFLDGEGRVPSRQALHRMVRRLCERAQVPPVCTHSLRGLYATLAVRSGAVTHAVAASLGHHSFAVTERHYAEPAEVANAATVHVLKILDRLLPSRN